MAISKNTSILIAAGIVILGVVAYFLWFRAPEATVTVESEGPASQAQATFISLASQLEPVGFDTGILTDSRFTALIDIKTAILPETAGRTDPFAPLPGVVVAQ